MLTSKNAKRKFRYIRNYFMERRIIFYRCLAAKMTKCPGYSHCTTATTTTYPACTADQNNGCKFWLCWGDVITHFKVKYLARQQLSVIVCNLSFPRAVSGVF